MQNKKYYAIYLRLSKEDEQEHAESNSISNQRKLIYDFINEKLQLRKNDILEFVDDGYSGTNFDRPAIKRLLDMVQERKIAGVLVKDLSRFGRDYVTVGDYLEHIFPFLQVRFIAVNDGFDSDDCKDNMPGLEIAYKNLFNEFYSTLLSYNIKRTLYQKWETGHCVHGAPYGYMKKDGQGNRLFLDPFSSRIVREVFDLTLQGTSRKEIVRRMNEKGIPTPGDYRKGKLGHVWTQATVLSILKNEVYTGVMIAGKYKRPEIGKAYAVKAPEESWKRYENAHPAIVSRQEYRQANTGIKEAPFNVIKSSLEQGLLTGILVCGHCSHNMQRRSRRDKSDTYFCGYSNNGINHTCIRKSCDENDIIKIVFPVIKMQLQLLFQADEILASAAHEKKKKRKDIGNRMKEAANKTAKLKNRRLQIYQMWKDGNITEEEYIAERESISRQLEVADDELLKLEKEAALSESIDTQKTFIAQFEEFKEADRLTRKLLESFVEKIYIWDIQHIQIKFRYQDQMAEILEMMKKV